MMFAPISMAHETVGILQLYSANPNSFGEDEISAVQPFITRSLEAWIEAQRGDQDSYEDRAESNLAVDDISEDRFTRVRETEGELPSSNYQSSRGRMKEFSGTLLFIAVLAVAILFGLVLGWKWGREQFLETSAQNLVASKPIAVASRSESSPAATNGSSAEEDSSSKRAVVAQSGTGVSSTTPPGGLVISQDGKIIYRSLDHPPNTSEYPPRLQQGTGLLHRVEPKYPPEALAGHIQGAVVLDVNVMGSGAVSDVVVRSGDPLLAAAAVEAVRQWQFQASRSTGGGERQTQITIRFTLSPN
jgi:TonB family protein